MDWIPPLAGYIKIDVDAFKRYTIGSTTIGIVGKEKHGVAVLQKGTQIEDFFTLVG